MRKAVWTRPRMVPITRAVDAEGILRFSRLTFFLLALISVSVADLHTFVLGSEKQEALKLR